MAAATGSVLQDNMVKSNIDKKFSAHYDAVEAELKSSTVGEYLWALFLTNLCEGTWMWRGRFIVAAEKRVQQLSWFSIILVQLKIKHKW